MHGYSNLPGTPIDSHCKCSHFVLMSADAPDQDGQLHTLGLLERLRAESGYLDQAASDLYYGVDALLRELRNPYLHDIANMSFRVEL
jgi:hypothetical protein